MSRVLLLTPSYQPHKIIDWGRAVTMLYTDKVQVVEETDEVIYRNGDRVVLMPSIVRLVRPASRVKRAVKFSRINVFTRDGFRCCYCNVSKVMREFNYDHVVPRHQGGKTTWENIVTACYACNTKKRNRTPEEAGMKLLRAPHRPRELPMLPPRFDPRQIPESWHAYCQGFLIEIAA